MINPLNVLRTSQAPDKHIASAATPIVMDFHVSEYLHHVMVMLPRDETLIPPASAGRFGKRDRRDVLYLKTSTATMQQGLPAPAMAGFSPAHHYLRLIGG
jgi:hypothetical protein